ncbi:GNAT family N-acetyltransferase [Cronobacter turicensis]|nr:GNAT family N-acetyltransferase [Cronobacter turicensis]
MTVYKFLQNCATSQEVAEHLSQCEETFVTSLAAKIAIPDYAKKITDHAWRTEAWLDNKLVGLVAAYFNDDTQQGFITNVSVLPQVQNRGIGSQLLTQCLSLLQTKGATEIGLEVDESNIPAQRLYMYKGFRRGAVANSTISMTFYGEKIK